MRLSIKATVTAAFLLLAGVAIGQGAFAIYSLRAINQSTREVVSNWLPSVIALGTIGADFGELRIKQFRAFVSRSDEPRRLAMEQVAAARARLDAALTRYEPLISSAEERAIYNDFKTKLTAYHGLWDRFLSLRAAGQDDEAFRLFTDDMVRQYDATLADARRDVEFNDRGASADGQIALATVKSTSDATLVAIVLVALAAIAGILVTLFRVVRPLVGMTTYMGVLASGDLNTEIPSRDRSDEIGQMASAVQVFKDGMLRNQQLEADAQQTRLDAEAARKASLQDLATQFETAVGGIVNIVSSSATELQATAQQLTSTSQETSSQAASVSSAAEEASANVTAVASAAEELGASVGEIGRQVQSSSAQATTAVSEAEATAAIIQELSEAAKRIDGIVEMISTIAGQTNLLALNATIEAARAGDAGRGFAVVAQEVKALAEQTSKATAEIGQQIAGIQTTTDRSVQAIAAISHTIRGISESSSAIAEAVNQQGAATREIVQAVEQASAGTNEVTFNISGVARASEETGQGAAQVFTASSELSYQAALLKTEVDRFLHTVRAA